MQGQAQGLTGLGRGRKMMRMAATLHVKSGEKEREYPCDALATIGRQEANDIVLADDPKASRNHAIVRCLGDGRYYVMDVGSANGTFVNGKRVFVPCALADGDEISIGSHVVTVRHEPDETETAAGRTEGDTEQTLLTLGRSVQTLTVLVADIRDYTPLSEQLSPDLLAAVLGRWFRAASEAVEMNAGTVDKFIGDALMARWLSSEQDTHRVVVAALKTAHELSAALQALNQEASDIPQPLRIGIGINTGQAVLANVGARGNRDYTALGDSVNVAFRLETATKTLKKDVAIGPDSYAHLPREAWENSLEQVTVKGKTDPLAVCALSFDELDGVVMGLSLVE